MIRGLALACLLHELPAAYARGVDQLDPATTIPWAETLVRSLDPAELRRALGAAPDGFLHEVAKVRPALAERLRKPLSLDPTA